MATSSTANVPRLGLDHTTTVPRSASITYWSVPQQIFQAAFWDELETLKTLVAKYPEIDLNLHEGSGYYDGNKEFYATPLHVACKHSGLPVVRFLIEHGASLTSVDFEQRTPLHYAVLRRRQEGIEVIEALLEFIHDPEARQRVVNLGDHHSRTALWLAMDGLSTPYDRCTHPVIKTMIRAGANPELKDAFGSTPAHKACAEGNLDVMKTLYNPQCAWINQPAGSSLQGRTCLHIAAATGNGPIIQWLIKFMEPEAKTLKDDLAMTAWDVACSNENYEQKFEAMAAFMYELWFGPCDCESDVSCTLKAYQFSMKYEMYFSFQLNSIAGVFSLFGELSKGEKISSEAVEQLLRELYGKRYSRSMLPARDPGFCFDEVLDSRGRSDLEGRLRRNTPDYLSLVMPCFHFQCQSKVVYWRNHSERAKFFTRDRRSHKYFSHCGSAESVGAYMSLTLHEYCNPMLPQVSLNKRNDDQVVLWTRSLGDQEWNGNNSADCDESSPADIELIVVGQAWIWSLDSVFIASPLFPFTDLTPSQSEPISLDRDSLLNIRTRLEDRQGGRCRAIGLALSRMISCLDTAQSPSSESILATFEKAIALVSEQVDKYVNVSGIEVIDTKAEKKCLHNISNVREELFMIGRVLTQQEDVFREFASTFWPQYWDSDRDGRLSIPRDEWAGFEYEARKDWRIIQQTQPQILKFRRRIAQLDEDAERVERSIMIQLELKLKDATIKESHAAAIMSATVLGFTIITIIFTPLSFVASLLALPIDQLQRHLMDNPYSDSTKMYSTNYVGMIAAITEVVSTLVTLRAIWFSIEFSLRVRVSHKIKRSMAGIFESVTRRKENAETKNEVVKKPVTNQADAQPHSENEKGPAYVRTISGEASQHSSNKGSYSQGGDGPFRQFLQRKHGKSDVEQV